MLLVRGRLTQSRETRAPFPLYRLQVDLAKKKEGKEGKVLAAETAGGIGKKRAYSTDSSPRRDVGWKVEMAERHGD